MNSTTAKLLRAAANMVGGERILAERLGIERALLDDLLTGQHELPERVLLGTVDIILAKHDAQPLMPCRSVGSLALDGSSDV